MNDRRQVVMVAGASSTGKTTFALRYLLNGPEHFRFVFDTNRDFARLMGCDPAETFPMAEWQLQQSGWAIFDPARAYPSDFGAGLVAFSDWAWALSESLPGQKVLVIDELTRLGVDPWNCPGSLQAVAQAGRRRNLGMIFTTHEPNRVPGALVGQLTEAVCFQIPFGQPLETMGKMGFATEELDRLPTGHYRARNMMTGGTLAGNLW